MLPHLPTINRDLGQSMDPPRPAPVLVPAPPKFRTPLGPIREVNIVAPSHQEYQAQRGDTSAQRAGLRYESRIQRALMDDFGTAYWPSPYIYYSDDRGRHCCIPDGLIVGLLSAVVVEIKSQHMPEAWWQLRRLYEPVLRKQFPHVSLVEICRSYDPHTPFPEPVKLIEEFVLDNGELGVMPWKI